MTILVQRRALLAALAVSACASGGGAAGELTLEEVIARHTRARGGAAALDGVRNTLNIATIVEPTFTVKGRYIASADGFMRVDVYYNGARAITEGIDTEGDWDWPAGEEPRPASEVARASGALAHGIEFNVFGLHALPRRGHTLTLEGRELIAGVNYYVVKIRLADGFETYRLINPDTWLVDRSRDFRALHPDADPTPTMIDTVHSDQRVVNGVMSPFHWTQIDTATGTELQNGTIHELRYNVSADELNFPRRAPVIAPPLP